jgi:AmmeMemoRadiSam system protein B/AmmeMemoRadiSam system protein A
MGIIRKAAVAGTFYPGVAKDLAASVTQLMIGKTIKVTQDISNKLRVLIVPHAGYIYSGAIAAKGYGIIEDEAFDTIVLIGPQHSRSFRGAAIYGDGEWATPLGRMQVDSVFANALATREQQIFHDRSYHDGEHSIEVQLPFLQHHHGSSKIVPIVTNDMQFAPRLAEVLLQTIGAQSGRVLVIASSDMTHYCQDEQTRRQDAHTLQAIEALDIEWLKHILFERQGELCGAAAVVTALALLQQLPDPKIAILGYETSAHASHNYESTVGYFSAAGTSSSWTRRDMLTGRQQSILLQIARISLGNLGQPMPHLDIGDATLQAHRAVFVTLTKDGQLRGCIGQVEPQESMPQAVYNMTQAAALHDGRFEPVSQQEIAALHVEISVLTLPRPIRSIEEIIYPGQGVVVQRDSQRGVFLPEVSKHFKTKEEFLNQLCIEKAGLEKECWLAPTTQIFVFETIHFEETHDSSIL